MGTKKVIYGHVTVPRRMEKQMEKNMENKMETGIVQRFKGCKVSRNSGSCLASLLPSQNQIP